MVIKRPFWDWDEEREREMDGWMVGCTRTGVAKWKCQPARLSVCQCLSVTIEWDKRCVQRWVQMKSACKSVQKAEHRIGQQKMMDQQRRKNREQSKEQKGARATNHDRSILSRQQTPWSSRRSLIKSPSKKKIQVSSRWDWELAR